MTTQLTDPAENDFVPSLEVHLEVLGSGCVLILDGILCATSIAALEAQVDQLGWLPCVDVTVDLGALRALDDTGARVLAGLHHYVLGRGGRFRIAGAAADIAATLAPYV
jgi:anti-anti-sigma regulatory factor